MSAKTRRTVNTALFDSIGAELITADPTERLPEKSLRVEYFPAELIRPDPVQPRRVLPEAIHFAFHSERLTPTQALRELIQIAQLAARSNGRPFANVGDLLIDLDSEEEIEAPKYTPEEQLLRDLVNLAITIRDDGQVNPLTIVDASQGVSRLYRIETGERRYWATWLLRDFLPGYEGDGTIPCIVIPSGRASVFRQAKENTARSGLSAVAMARQAALLILAVHGIEKPTGSVTNDFYRQALDLNLRDKREYSNDVLVAMGGISRVHFSRYKALLRLSDEALELADRYSLDEGRLRYVVNLEWGDHVEMVRQIIKFNLAGKQVKEMCESNHSQSESSESPSRGAKQFVSFLKHSQSLTPQEFADELLKQEKQNVHLARARIQQIKELIDQIEAHLNEG